MRFDFCKLHMLKVNQDALRAVARSEKRARMVGDTRSKILMHLKRSPSGLGTDVLAVALGVTVTAARQHLVALERDGLVARGASVPSGGRPQQLYVLTAKALETFPRQYSWFSEVLLDAMRAEMGSEKLKKTLRILGQDAAAAAGPPRGTLSERAHVLAARMHELGYDARVVEKKNGGVEIAARNCVFHKLAEKHREVCSFDLGLIGAASGAFVDHDECIALGGSECRFKLRTTRESKNSK